MATQKLRHPSLRPIITLKSSMDPSISFKVVVTTHPHCHSIIANGGKSQSSPIYHLGHPNDINEKKKMIKKKQQLSGKSSRYGKRSKVFNLKSAVSCILNKAKTVLQVQLPNSVFRVGRDGRRMECVEPYFSVPVVPVMATH